MPEGGGRRSRTVSGSGRTGARPATEMTALILAQGDQNGNLDNITDDSKALLQVANKPQLYYSIKQLEDVGFAKSNIYVAITAEDLEHYEADERVIPIESRIPPKNYIKVRDFESSADSLCKAFAEIEKSVGLPRYLLVVYVDIISCGVLPNVAEVNRIRDSAFISVYGPRDHPTKDLPGTEAIHHTEKVTKLVFFSGDGVIKNKNLRKLYLTIDTDNYDGEEIRLSRRVLDQSDGHIEVCSDLDDQGVFLIRDDLVKWIIRNSENYEWESIRDEMVPTLLKNQYKEEFSEDVECLAYIDPVSTCRLDSIANYISAHRAVLERKLLTQYLPKKGETDLSSLKNADVCPYSVIGENVTRFNHAETERLVREERESSNRHDSESGSHNSASESSSKVIIRKSIIGSKCLFEYDFSDNKQKTTQVTNSIVHNNVTVLTGCKINNCIISRGAVIGEKCTLINCIVGPGTKIEPKKNLKNQCLDNDE